MIWSCVGDDVRVVVCYGDIGVTWFGWCVGDVCDS